MDSGASVAEYFSIAGDRQRLLVSMNTRETRENWFKAYPEVNPANQLLNVVKVETIAALVAGNRRHQGVITVIT